MNHTSRYVIIATYVQKVTSGVTLHCLTHSTEMLDFFVRAENVAKLLHFCMYLHKFYVANHSCLPGYFGSTSYAT